MTTGFEVLRQDGKVAISSVFPHYSFIKKIRGVNNFWDTSGTTYSDHVLVAFIPVSYGDASASSYRFSKGAMNLWGYVGIPAPPANAKLSMFSNVLCDAYVFDVTAPTNDSGVGVRVHNEAGLITFDSEERYMIIADVIQSLSAWSGRDQYDDPYFTKIYPANTKVAVCPLKFAYINEYSSSAEEQKYSRTWESVIAANVLRVTMVSAYEDYYGGGGGVSRDDTYLCLVIDVSNTELP